MFPCRFLPFLRRNFRHFSGKWTKFPRILGTFPLWFTRYWALHGAYTGELPETRRESEPNTCKFTALSPWGDKIPIANTFIGLAALHGSISRFHFTVPFHGSIFVSDKATSRTKRCKISWGKKENRILSAYFPPHVHLTKLDNIDNQRAVKTRSGFGYFSTYPSAGYLLASY